MMVLPRLVFNATCSAVLAIIDIGQNASNPDPSATNEAVTKVNDGPTSNGGTAPKLATEAVLEV
jgi:hypothetical protein